MQYALCLKDRILHNIEEQDVLIEFLNIEHLIPHGYAVVAIDDEDIIHPVSYVDGKILVAESSITH